MIHRSKVKLFAGYEAELCTSLPKDEFGDCDLDRAKYRYKEFATLEDARDWAKQHFAGSPFGVVIIHKFRMEPVSDEYPNILDMEYDDNFFEEVS